MQNIIEYINTKCIKFFDNFCFYYDHTVMIPKNIFVAFALIVYSIIVIIYYEVITFQHIESMSVTYKKSKEK